MQETLGVWWVKPLSGLRLISRDQRSRHKASFDNDEASVLTAVLSNPQSAIRNPQSAIRNPQSAIRNPQS
jgi:hypothetical protein